MTAGQILKKELGLEKFKYCKISRVIQFSYNVLFIWYDSRHTTLPLTTRRIMEWPWVAMIFSGTDIDHGKARRPSFTPPISLEGYNGEIKGAMIFMVDISGKYYIDTKEFPKKLEAFPLTKVILSEFTTFDDFRKNSLSQRNHDWYKDRKTNGNTGSFLSQVTWNHAKDTLTIRFRTKPTYINKKNPHEKNKVVKQVKITYPAYTGAKGSERLAKNYSIFLQLKGVNEYLGTRKDFMTFTPKEQGELILDILKNAEARLWSNDMSYYWQGAWENMGELDASAYPFKGTKGIGVWNKKHDGEFHLTKHFVEIFQIIYNNYAIIAKYIRDRIKT